MPATDVDTSDLSLLIAAAKGAGEIALRFNGPDARRWDKPDGQGPVTEADLAVNAYLEDRLQQARPDYGWLSEETEDAPSRRTQDILFIVDPIDGTRSFAEGSTLWGHSLAIVGPDGPRAAVMYFPRRDLMFTAAHGQGAQCNGSSISVSHDQDLAQAEVLTTRPNLRSHHWKYATVPTFKQAQRPSLCYRLGRVADGRSAGMLTLRRSWEWDIAAGDLIVREAGGRITDRFGNPLRYNNPIPQLDGVLAATPAIHSQLLAALDPDGPGISTQIG